MSISHLLNANTHRFKEGARVLEDLARFVLKNDDLFKQVRKLRHSLRSFPIKPIAENDSGGSEFVEDNLRSNLVDVVQANALRMQESLRVLEEVSKDSAEKQMIKSLRYQCYKVHQLLYEATCSYVKKDKLKGLYLVIDTNIITRPLVEAVKVINKSSVNLVQLRNTVLSKHAFFKQAIQLKSMLNPEKLLIVNDHFDIALDIADGVHLGQLDYPIERVRQLAADDFIVGVTCHNLKEADRAAKAGASYLSVDSASNELRATSDKIPLPICVIGRISHDNVAEVLACNVDMVAVISSLWDADDLPHEIELIQKQFNN